MKHFLGLPIAAALTFATMSLAQAEDLVFEVINDTSVDLIAIFISPSSVDDWEQDVLGSDVLPSGYAMDVVVADGREDCFYDIQGIFEDGDTVEDYEIDLCELGAYTFYEE